MNPYAIAYAIGYFYGRSYRPHEEIVLPPEDMVHRENQGFADGLAAGRRDFEEIDLPIIALAQSELDIQ